MCMLIECNIVVLLTRAHLTDMLAETLLSTEEPKLQREVQEHLLSEKNPPGTQLCPTGTTTTQAHHTAGVRDAVTERCGYCGEHSDDNMLCTGCRRAYYCSRSCQKKDRKDHKSSCKKPEEPVDYTSLKSGNDSVETAADKPGKCA